MATREEINQVVRNTAMLYSLRLANDSAYRTLRKSADVRVKRAAADAMTALDNAEREVRTCTIFDPTGL